ncbi:MAG TPA: PEP-CTERM sorting domain-containing protein [Lacipirellulaceae bacterium]|nr:PEP-CTERM sorting domain-containing protein [Lacipirellulaceae bacterium]HMP06497.1 PEP-CTERM sorting domain-containing protein [Lacipirellulaceae bacterium]
MTSAYRLFRQMMTICIGGCLLSTPLAGTACAALLDGKRISVSLEHITNQGGQELILSQVVTVGPGVELTGFGERTEPDLPALVDIDISDTTILITLLIEQPWAYLERLNFADVMNNLPPIKNVTVDPATDWAGFFAGRMSFSTEIISVNLGQLAGSAGQKVLLNVTPEPAAATLLLLGGLGAIAARRRRQAPIHVGTK